MFLRCQLGGATKVIKYTHGKMKYTIFKIRQFREIFFTPSHLKSKRRFFSEKYFFLKQKKSKF